MYYESITKKFIVKIITQNSELFKILLSKTKLYSIITHKLLELFRKLSLDKNSKLYLLIQINYLI